MKNILTEKYHQNAWVWFGVSGVGCFAGVSFLVRYGSDNNYIAWSFLAATIAFLSFFPCVVSAWMLIAHLDWYRRFRVKWARACRVLGIHVEGKTPLLRRLVVDPYSFDAEVCLWPGQTIEHLKSKVDDLAKILGVGYVTFDFVDGGAIKLTAIIHGSPPVIQQAISDYQVAAETVEVKKEREYTPVELLAAVPVGLDDYGNKFRISVIDNHILLCGESGSGKSSWVWSLVAGLKPAVSASVVRLWGIDPKQLELSIAPAWWDEYASDTPDCVQLLTRFEQEMRARNKSMAGVVRKFKPSKQTPLNVLLIDELADLMTGVEKKQAELMNRLLTAILRQGRAAGYVVIGATQSPLKEAVPCRDDFITKVGLRMRSSLVDTLLGTGAKDAGARCWEIPFKVGAGTAFVIGENGQALRVRAYWLDDDVIQRAGQLARMGEPLEFKPEYERPGLGYGQIEGEAI